MLGDSVPRLSEEVLPARTLGLCSVRFQRWLDLGVLGASQTFIKVSHMKAKQGGNTPQSRDLTFLGLWGCALCASRGGSILERTFSFRVFSLRCPIRLQVFWLL